MIGTLVLEDGSVYKGAIAGFPSETFGELVFHTGQTGYEEIITDPSYSDQIVALSTPHVGNTGINFSDQESTGIHVNALICRRLSGAADHSMSVQTLSDYFYKQEKMILHNINCRALVKRVREHGALKCIISAIDSDIESLKAKLVDHCKTQNTSHVVALKRPRAIINSGGLRRIAVLDFGIKQGIVDQLVKQNLELHLFPHTSSLSEIEAIHPDGVFLSNGPGDPSDLPYILPTVRKLAENYPTYGICLGHQLLAAAFGAETYKLKFGHHAANHPVLNKETGSVEITSQNHNYAVNLSGVSELEETHIHLNDGTVAGMKHRFLPVASVQFHPEANPGPKDSHDFFHHFFHALAQKKVA
jgi:carbamoyl-phosphate synthase small subunit